MTSLKETSWNFFFLHLYKASQWAVAVIQMFCRERDINEWIVDTLHKVVQPLEILTHIGKLLGVAKLYKAFTIVNLTMFSGSINKYTDCFKEFRYLVRPRPRNA